ncbi:hypothetical protein [Methylocapsa aurea]|uniref:hypothetical protein n=1 Tax=Methylocapsa aurea TaxID=663610 RepID=UPI0012EBF619|nr:hypothetical protein [Methylocapsa aurea]
MNKKKAPAPHCGTGEQLTPERPIRSTCSLQAIDQDATFKLLQNLDALGATCSSLAIVAVHSNAIEAGRTAINARFLQRPSQRINLAFKLRDFMLQIADALFISFDQGPNASVDHRRHWRLPIDQGRQNRSNNPNHRANSAGAKRIPDGAITFHHHSRLSTVGKFKVQAWNALSGIDRAHYSVALM